MVPRSRGFSLWSPLVYLISNVTSNMPRGWLDVRGLVQVHSGEPKLWQTEELTALDPIAIAWLGSTCTLCLSWIIAHIFVNVNVKINRGDVHSLIIWHMHITHSQFCTPREHDTLWDLLGLSCGRPVSQVDLPSMKETRVKLWISLAENRPDTVPTANLPPSQNLTILTHCVCEQSCTLKPSPPSHSPPLSLSLPLSTTLPPCFPLPAYLSWTNVSRHSVTRNLNSATVQYVTTVRNTWYSQEPLCHYLF